MSRVTSGVTTHRRHKKITDQAKGYYGRRKNTFKVATQAVDKQINTQRVIAITGKEIFVVCGSNE